MSAVATAEAVPTSDAVLAPAATTPGRSTHEVETKEMYRWMLWFGAPIEASQLGSSGAGAA
jgi:hypothetical protein